MLLVVKKGSKMRSRIVGLHAMAGILDRQPYIRSRLEVWRDGGSVKRYLDGFETYLDHTTGLAHGMGRIGTEVNQHLLHLGGVCQDSASVPVNDGPYRNGRGQGCAQQRQCFLDQQMQLDGGASEFGLTTESQDLLDQVSGTPPSGERALQIVPHRTALLHLV